MVQLNCGFPGCNYTTPELNSTEAIAVLGTHSPYHNTEKHTTNRAERMKRPSITTDITMQDWIHTLRSWNLYKKSAGISEADATTELLACCNVELLNNLFRAHAKIEDEPEKETLQAIKKICRKNRKPSSCTS